MITVNTPVCGGQLKYLAEGEYRYTFAIYESLLSLSYTQVEIVMSSAPGDVGYIFEQAEKEGMTVTDLVTELEALDILCEMYVTYIPWYSRWRSSLAFYEPIFVYRTAQL